MHSTIKPFIILVIVTLLVLACKSTRSVSTTKSAVSTNQQLAKDIYANKCAKCHKLFAPEKYSKEEWNVAVVRMAPKAKLTDEEKTLILSLAVK